MTTQEYKAAMLPHWEEFQREYQAAWALYGTGFHNFRNPANAAAEKYHRIAAELWARVIL